MKLVFMHGPTKIATVECDYGGQTVIPTFGTTEENPARGQCPLCWLYLLYPNDLEKK